jgi:hypothetical protein
MPPTPLSQVVWTPDVLQIVARVNVQRGHDKVQEVCVSCHGKQSVGNVKLATAMTAAKQPREKGFTTADRATTMKLFPFALSMIRQGYYGTNTLVGLLRIAPYCLTIALLLRSNA